MKMRTREGNAQLALLMVGVSGLTALIGFAFTCPALPADVQLTGSFIMVAGVGLMCATAAVVLTVLIYHNLKDGEL